jgi:hypothetical protein
LSPPVIAKPVFTPTATSAPIPAAAPKKEAATTEVLDGLKAMDGMQKAVAKNMEKTLTVPIFRVSRFFIIYLLFF